MIPLQKDFNEIGLSEFTGAHFIYTEKQLNGLFTLFITLTEWGQSIFIYSNSMNNMDRLKAFLHIHNTPFSYIFENVFSFKVEI